MVSRRTFISAPLAMLATSLPSITNAFNNKEIKIGLSLSPESLDPTSTAPVVVGEITYDNIFQGLTAIDENGNVIPKLAKKWLISDDQLKYTFEIRPDIYFSDGKRLDAETVKYSLQRAISLKNKNKLYDNLFKNIKNVTVIDNFNIEIQLHKPNPLTLFRLAEPPAVILHPATHNQASTNPIGTGPYRIEKWIKSENKITLVKWINHKDAKKTKINRAIFYFIPSANERIQAIKDGKLDILFHMTAISIEEFQYNNKYELLFGGSSSKCLIAINNKRYPLDKIEVRRAFAHAIDREGIINSAFLGRGQAIGSHFSPSEPGYINLTSRYDYNVEKSKQLLKDSGIQLPLSLNLDLPPTPYAVAAGKQLVKYFDAINIHINIRHLNWNEWVQTVFAGNFDLAFILHAEPLDFSIYTNPNYYFGYDSKEFVQLFEQYQNSTNLRLRNRLLQDMQRKLSNDCVNVWIVSPEIATLTKRGVKGVWVNYPIFVHNIQEMYWD